MKAMFAAVAVAAFLASAAAASATTDPRKCDYGPTRKADCARTAATMATRRYLTRITGQKYLWQPEVICTNTRTLLRWRCSTTYRSATSSNGIVVVTYKATSKGWTVKTVLG